MKKTAICLYCGTDYVPKRRGVQKFCSNSCRSLNWKDKQPIKESKTASIQPINDAPTVPDKPTLQEKMSLAGVGNAAAGAAVVEIAKNLVTPNAGKPATKKDIDDLKAFLRSRYFLVKNKERDSLGRPAYYDMVTGNVVHR